MEAFSALLAICPGNSPVTGEFPAQWPVTRSFSVFFDLCLNKRLGKQWWRWWFETPSHPLWCHCNDVSGAHSTNGYSLVTLFEFVLIQISIKGLWHTFANWRDICIVVVWAKTFYRSDDKEIIIQRKCMLQSDFHCGWKKCKWSGTGSLLTKP